MRAVPVVGVAQQVQPRLQFGLVLQVEHPQQLLERRPGALDAAVHPGAVRLDALVADAEPAQRKRERPGGENRFVVSSDAFWFSVMFDGFEQQPQQCNRTFLAYRFQLQYTTAAVIDDAEDHLWNIRH